MKRVRRLSFRRDYRERVFAEISIHQVLNHWIHIQRVTKGIRIPLIIWLRSEGLFKSFVWTVTQMLLRKAHRVMTVSESLKDELVVGGANFNHASWLTRVDSMCRGCCPTVYSCEARSWVGGFDDVRGEVVLLKRLEPLKAVQPELGQKCRLHGGNASQTLMEERKVWLENRVQEIQSWKRQEQFRLSPKTTTWKSLLPVES